MLIPWCWTCPEYVLNQWCVGEGTAVRVTAFGPNHPPSSCCCLVSYPINTKLLSRIQDCFISSRIKRWKISLQIGSKSPSAEFLPPAQNSSNWAEAKGRASKVLVPIMLLCEFLEGALFGIHEFQPCVPTPVITCSTTSALILVIICSILIPTALLCCSHPTSGYL